MKNNKLFSKIMSFVMALALAFDLFPIHNLRAGKTAENAADKEIEETETAEDEEIEETETAEDEEITWEVIEINSTDDFLSFADNCFLDSWSSDKHVLLNTDINLLNTDFDTVPIFTGIFDGQNHTISGFQYKGDGYVAGLFRYIGKNGLVENLNVTGEIIASDEKECIGGLCGINYGNIHNCSFRGNVRGKTTIGGLVGVNEGTGTIQDCFSGGHITGYYATGGIAGTNHGILSNCTNRASINNDSEWVEEDDEMGTGIFFSINIDESETELFSGVDTGGISGYSDGIITRCINYGTIGYEHTGYNIGGIAGRQCGIISLCSNQGTIYGRKDIGGIVGQMEPYIEVDEAESLRNAVNKLHDLIEKTIDDMESGKNAAKRDLDDLAAYSEGAVDAGDALAGQISEFVDANIDQAQAMTDRLDDIAEMLPLIFDDIYSAEDSFSSANRSLMLIGDDLKEIGNLEGEYVETDYNRLTLLSTVGGNILSIQQHPAAGETVSIMVEPDTGYQLSTITAIDASGNRLLITKNDNEYYSFVMPEPNVRVEACFTWQGINGTSNTRTDKTISETDETKTDETDTDNQTETDQNIKDSENDKTDSETDSADDKTDTEADSENDKTDTDTDSADDKTDAESGSDSGKADTDAGSDTNNADPDAGSNDNNADVGKKSNGSRADTKSIQTSGTAADNQEIQVSTFLYKPEKRMSANTDAPAVVKEIAAEPKPLDNNAAVIQFTSNLSGNASYRISGTTATVTVTPDGGYTVSGTPTVTADGRTVPVTKAYQSEYAYSFPVDGSSLYQVNIVFQKLDKAQTINGASGEISSAISRQQAAAEKVNAIMREIQESSNVTSEQLEELEQALEEMSNATYAVLSNLSVVSNIAGKQAVDTLQSMGDELADAMNHLQKAVDSIKSATRDTKSIVDYVNGQPGIHFSKLGTEFTANRNALHDQLHKMSESLQHLSDDASSYSDIINDDLRAVNDQINLVFNLLTDTLTNYGDVSVEELYEDVDIEDTDSITSGKTDNCINKGIIQGDINVGGIAGAMSIDEEDPEDNAAGNMDYQIGRRYFTKCVITDSVNEGYITAKKDGAGGIAGYMKHGIVVNSEGYGSVESTEGDYVGGICGESFTVIKSCYSLCSVSGNRNVGGIAGFADTVKDCYAMADCTAVSGRKGAIAGQTVNYEDTMNEEEVKISGNYYVGDNLYGIDNISYTGIAEPISYDELLTAPNLPTAFRHLKVIFRVEDSYLGEQEVAFGESLSALDYPAIPEKEGYYGSWPDYSDKIMSGNLLITGEYKENVTVVQSNEKAVEANSGYEKPYALVEDRFTQDTILNAAVSDTNPPENALNKQSVVYDISLENAEISDSETFAIRLLNPYENAEVWGYQNNTWSKLESKVRGQYLQVNMSGKTQTFCIIEHKSAAWIIIGCAAGLIVLLLVFTVLMKKSKAKFAKKK